MVKKNFGACVFIISSESLQVVGVGGKWTVGVLDKRMNVTNATPAASDLLNFAKKVCFHSSFIGKIFGYDLNGNYTAVQLLVCFGLSFFKDRIEL